MPHLGERDRDRTHARATDARRHGDDAGSPDRAARAGRSSSGSRSDGGGHDATIDVMATPVDQTGQGADASGRRRARYAASDRVSSPRRERDRLAAASRSATAEARRRRRSVTITAPLTSVSQRDVVASDGRRPRRPRARGSRACPVTATSCTVLAPPRPISRSQPAYSRHVAARSRRPDAARRRLRRPTVSMSRGEAFAGDLVNRQRRSSR